MLTAKKSLGQHFLKDENIAQKIVRSFLDKLQGASVLEIGPGQGMLTKYLLKEKGLNVYAVEFDARMVSHLRQLFPQFCDKLFLADILEFDMRLIDEDEVSIIGNFPYNISSQILFKILDNKERVPLVAGMFQKEVARRITSSHGNKEYGILSVLLQSFYDCDYVFEVGEKCFRPVPKVKSAVVHLTKKKQQPKIADEIFFFKLVKSGFGQRRKMLRNSLNEMVPDKETFSDSIFDLRAEQLSIAEWIELSNRLSQQK